MKIAFLGSSEFSLIVLKAICESENNKVCCVVCNEDKAVGRGKKIVFSPVKEYALKNNIPLYQTSKISNVEGENFLKDFNVDCLVTASFGQLLKKNILNLAPFGVINVHASLLPEYRGSCPINWMIINGEKYAGVTIMKTAVGLDTGDMILKESTEILPDETSGELTLRLASLGAKLLLQALPQIENGLAKYEVQDEEKSSYFPKLERENCGIDFDWSAKKIQNFCNGLNPWPIAFCSLNGEVLKVYKAKEQMNKWQLNLNDFNNGEVVLSTPKSGLIVKCGDNELVLLDIIQAPNGKMMPSKSYLNGKKIEVKTSLKTEILK